MNARDEYYEELLETTRSIRLELTMVPMHSADARELRTHLAGVLLERAEVITEVDGLALPPLVEDDAEPLWRESSTLIKELFGEVPEGTGHWRRLCWMAAQSLRIEGLVSKNAVSLDDMIGWLESAMAPPAAPPDVWWGPEADGDARTQAGLLYAERFADSEAADDRARVVELLGALADLDPAGQDHEFLAVAWTELARALSDTARDPETGEPLPPLDRARAARLWQKAFDLDEIDSDLRSDLVGELGRLRWTVLDWSRPEASEELRELLAILSPGVVAPVDSRVGAEILDLCLVMLHDLLEHDPGPEHRLLAVEWYRLAVGHPGVTVEELRSYRQDLALALVEVVIEEDWPQTEPRRHAFLREALTNIDAVHADLAVTKPAADELAHVTGFLFDVLARLDHDGVEPEVTDRAIAVGAELLATMRPEDTLRPELHIRVGSLMVARAYRRLQPYFDAMEHDMAGLASTLVVTLGSSDPELVAEFAQAADLLRAGLSLFPVQDESYPMAAFILGHGLMVQFLMSFPFGDRMLLREGLDWQRKVYDINPQSWAVSLAERRHMILMTVSVLLMVDTSQRYIAAANRAEEQMDLSIEAMTPTLVEELFFAQRLVDAVFDESDAPEPLFTVLGYNLEVRSWASKPPSRARVELWSQRFQTAIDRLGDFPPVQRFILQGLHAMLDILLAEMTGGGAIAVWAAAARLRALRSTLPEGVSAAFIDDVLAKVDAEPADILVTLTELMGPMPPGPVANRETEAGEPPLPLLGADSIRPEGFGVLAASVAPLLGDGSESPFADPPGVIIETLDRLFGPADAGGRRDPVPAALAAEALHARWLRQRDPADISLAVRLARRAASAFVQSRPDLADRLDAVVAGFLHDRYLLYGDHADLEAARATWSALLERTPEGPRPGLGVLLNAAAAEDDVLGVRELFRADVPDESPFRAELLAFAGLADLAAADLVARDDGTDLATEDVAFTAAQLRTLGRQRLTSALAGLDPWHPLRPAVLGETALARWTEAGRRADIAARIIAAADIAAAATVGTETSQHRPGLLLRAAAVAAAHLADPRTRDTGLVLAADLVRELSEVTRGSSALYYGGWARCQYGLGELLAARHRVTGDPEDLNRAIAALIEAENVHGPAFADPFAAALKRSLASAYRAGATDPSRRRRSRVAARSVMWAHGRSVLLQSGTRRALEAARRAGEDAARLVRWCLADDDAPGALEAVELGRGLTLHAATVASTVPVLLAAAGHEGLAAEWRAADAGFPDAESLGAASSEILPDDLRRRVLLAVESSPVERRLLSAPSAAETGRALVMIGADAFVYLLADTGRGDGHALIVDASGTLRTVLIEGLSVDGEELTAYAAALRARDAVDAEVGAAADWHKALLGLCAWAGRMMAPVLDDVRATVADRAPRLVLVPVGALGMVPWHAGTLPTPAGPARHVCQDAVVSYCATARQLAEVAVRPRLPVTGAAVMVVDPGSSSIANKEAALLRFRFYPDADVVGSIGYHSHQSDPAWRPPRYLPPLADVLDPYLPGRGPTSAAVVIANCHALSTADASRSRLILDRHRTEPDRVLTVDRLLAGASVRDAQAPGGLVVLADCVTDLAVANYDESVTLATAVLASGACSVVGSKWAIADQPQTLILMYMFHFFLHEAGSTSAGSPADALRAAQMWMLDPDRVVPDRADEAAFARLEEKNLADPVFWAAFTHHGH